VDTNQTWKLRLGLLGAFTVFVLAALGGAPARAAEAPPTPHGRAHGRPRRRQARGVPAPPHSVEIAVSGFLARATVTQTFTNPYDRRIEAVYVFRCPRTRP